MARDATPTAIHLRDYRPPAFLIDAASLYVDLREKGTLVAGRLRIRRNTEGPAQRDLRLDGEGLTLIRVALDGRDLAEPAFRPEADGLVVCDVPDRFELYTEVRIAPESNTALEGLYRSGGMFCTQCEAEGFRRITYFLDRPDVMARFTTTVEADRSRYPVLLSNGNPVSTEDLPDGRHRAVWEDPIPKPSYLFALVAGDLARLEDSFTTASGREVALCIYSEPDNIGRCDHAMASLKRAMRWDEEKYGREYDLDVYNIVAANDFNMGAMENKGLNVFNAKYVLASPETATDDDYQYVEGVIAHEYFHNWTGNRITCRDWFQLSLKEGLTVFRDQEFSSDMGSRGVKRIQDVRNLRAHQFAEDAGPMAHPVRPASYIEINNFYTLTVYEKGAEVVRMQHNLLGPEVFRRAMDLYFERHDGQAVTTDDFVRCMADASGRDLEQFKRWYSQAGTPVVAVSARYDAAEKVYELRMRQSCPPTPGQAEKQPFHIPVAVGLLDADGRDVPLRLAGAAGGCVATRVLELTETDQRFRFEGIEERPVPSLLRGFSAPVHLEYDYSDEELQFLMARDTDGFNRWDAAQRLHLRVLLASVADPQAPVPAGYLDACRLALNDGSGDGALLAEVLTLPSEGYLGERMAVVDVDAIHAAREGLRTHLATGLRDDLMAVYRANGAESAYAHHAPAIARRRLKNLCLTYLGRLAHDGEVHDLCVRQYREADNMTDALAALTLAAWGDMLEREELLADFERRWRHEPLVLDKWLAIQAASPRPDTLARVGELMSHPAFSLRNPNRVRALIGTFVAGNPVRFHDLSGEGYALLADVVTELDALNPQVAARLLRHMSRWRRYDEVRQGLMRTRLERILAREGLSKDSFEVASKSLQTA